ncbi:MAG: NAD-dependent epimerase/dehydratase family protein [Acidobacteria bacterium]|nr:NAD-dependent epimerase/dehydratase family protein [Acidobacteriota bacterium]
MKILVTGGAGFIGSHIADAYLSEGHQVVIIDNLITGQEKNINPLAKFYKLDIRERELRKILVDESPDVVSHQAAQVDIRRSVQDPCYDADVNITGGLNLFEGSIEAKVKHIIFASTGGAIYGEQNSFPASELHSLNPLSPYGISKLSIEKYLAYYKEVYNLTYTILRYGNVYGPRQNPKGEAGVIAIFCEQMLRGKTPIINGDGKQTRDYIYVKDVVESNLLALKNYQESASNQIFNVGTSIETDVITIFKSLQKLLKSSFPQTHGVAKAGEQRRSVLDISKTKEKLSWQPKVDLLAGLKETLDFYLNQQTLVSES